MSDDSFIREVNDEMRREQAQKLWDRFGPALLGIAINSLGIGVLGVLWCLFDRPWRQCWHDKAAHTFVAA